MDPRSIEERVGHALGSADLMGDALRITDADLIAAFALTASRVGASCWRLKYADDVRHSEVRLVVAKVARTLSGRFRRPSPLMLLVAAEALYEWINDRCRPCKGRGWVGFAAFLDDRTGTMPPSHQGGLKACAVCNGTGALRRRPNERIAALNRAIAEWNAQVGNQIRPLTTEPTGLRWASRIDDGVGYIRTQADYHAAVRKKLG